MSIMDTVTPLSASWGKPRLALLGSTGLVGTTLLKSLVARSDVWDGVALFDVPDRCSQLIPVRGEYLQVQALSGDALEAIDVAICALPPALAQKWVPLAAEQGAVVVDCSGVFRDDLNIPLVAAPLGTAALPDAPRRIITSPGSLSLSAALALAPLHRAFGLTDVTVTALSPASASGRTGIERLQSEMSVLANNRDLGSRSGDVRARVLDQLDPSASPFSAPLALNVSPWVGAPSVDPDSATEKAFTAEVSRLLGADDLRVSVTVLQVPVLVGETLVFSCKFARPAPVDAARDILVNAPSVVVVDDTETLDLPNPIDAVGSDPAFTGRIRQMNGGSRGLTFVQCSDNLRLGSALNAVLIAEKLAELSMHPQRPS